jgi:uncharacterized protein YeaO (DUF488 family)
MIRIKRAYEKPSPADGVRVLIDRLWPRGLTKQEAHLDAWRRELSPSTELRRWYQHDPAKFNEFRARYRQELSPHAEALQDLAEKGRKGTLTLVYSSKETTLSNAAVLKELLDELMRS